MKPAIFLLALALFQIATSQTFVTMYKDSSYRGENLTFGNLDHVTKISMDSMNDKMTSFKLTSGTCALMYVDDPPTHQSGKYFASLSDDPNVGSQFSDKISSISRCGTYSKTIQCPPGQFVKNISYDNSNSLRTGIQLSCSLPKSMSSSGNYRSLGTSTLPNSERCHVAHGIQFTRNTTLASHTRMSLLCRRTNSTGFTYGCGDHEALVGLTFQIENISNFVKSSSIICRDVGKIESTCTPQDKLSVMLTCDASNETELVRCSHNGIVGYDLTVFPNQDDDVELAFYSVFGFDLGAVANGLFANFKNLGVSNNTGYNWTKPSDDAFRPVITTTVGARAAPGCITQIMEVVGKCAFMEVRPFHLERVDNCFGSVFVNEVVVPKSFEVSNKRSGKKQGSNEFISEIPDNVSKYLEKIKYAA